MSVFYIPMLGITAFVIAITGAYFSVFGLAQLFSGAAIEIVVMASTLEFAKFVTSGFLYRYWGHIHSFLRVYLAITVVTLMGITSMGIFGFLSNAYQRSSFELRTQNLKLAALQEDDKRIHTQIAEFRRFVDEIPANRISRKYEFQKIYDPQIRRLQLNSNKIQEQINALKMQTLTTQTKIGPIIYAAEAIGADPDTVVKYLIFVFVAVFDPLAVSLILCWNLAILLRDKYRGNEQKIAAHSVMAPPVDHRFSRRKNKAA